MEEVRENEGGESDRKRERESEKERERGRERQRTIMQERDPSSNDSSAYCHSRLRYHRGPDWVTCCSTLTTALCFFTKHTQESTGSVVYATPLLTHTLSAALTHSRHYRVAGWRGLHLL